MARGSIVFIILLLGILLGCCLPGCHNSNAAPAKGGFRDERSMRDALKGTWILQEYVDSIDAGLTPKLLEFMLTGLYSIKYSSDSECHFVAGIGKVRITAEYDKAWSDVPYSVHLIPSSNNLVFTNKDTKRSDTAILVIDGADTILRLSIDSVSICFVKYDVGACKNVDVFGHLVNSRFIVGKYYAITDTARAHHIIFTRCGNIEGGDYISPELKGCSEYNIQLTRFLQYPDVISFYNPAYKLGRPYNWEVVEDTLRLYNQHVDGHERSILLVKAR